MNDLVERAELGGKVPDESAEDRLLDSEPLILIVSKVFRHLAGMERIDALFDDHRELSSKVMARPEVLEFCRGSNHLLRASVAGDHRPPSHPPWQSAHCFRSRAFTLGAS